MRLRPPPSSWTWCRGSTYLGFKKDDSETEDADEKAGSDNTDPEVSLEVKRSKMLGLEKEIQIQGQLGHRGHGH